MEYDELKLIEIKQFIEGHGGADEVARFIASKKTNELSGLICVDRSIRPKYPNWVRKVLYEAFHPGPEEFDVGKLRQWTHDQQKHGNVEGYIVHNFLKSHDMIKHCIDLRDLEEMKKKGHAFFRKYFGEGRVCVFAWKSTVRDGSDSETTLGYLRTPCLFVDEDDQEDIFWFWLNNDLFFHHITLLHASTDS
jgi:hypothetical protein